MADTPSTSNQRVNLDDTPQEQEWVRASNRAMKDKLRKCNFFQINLHHSKLASAELMARLQNEMTFVAMVQEPWLGPKHKIYGLKLGTTHSVKERARATVVTSRGLGAWPVHQFTNRDIATVCMRFGDRLLYLASVYMDGYVDQDLTSRSVSVLLEVFLDLL